MPGANHRRSEVDLDRDPTPLPPHPSYRDSDTALYGHPMTSPLPTCPIDPVI